MKNFIAITASAALLLTGCSKYEKTESGISYRILAHEEGNRTATKNDMVQTHLRMEVVSNDSLLMETFSDNSSRFIPGDEPVLGEIFALLGKGDSAEVLVNADTLFLKSFGRPKPDNFAADEQIRFVLKIVDVMNQDELNRKRMEEMSVLLEKDSVSLQQYLGSLKNVQTTASGLNYIVTKPGTGKQAKKGDKVLVKYKGYLTNGNVFEDNMQEGAEFTIGLGQVIQGWDEGIVMMKEGAEYKLIIPWKLGYGMQGKPPIPPFTSLVFDVVLAKVN